MSIAIDCCNWLILLWHSQKLRKNTVLAARNVPEPNGLNPGRELFGALTNNRKCIPSNNSQRLWQGVVSVKLQTDTHSFVSAFVLFSLFFGNDQNRTPSFTARSVAAITKTKRKPPSCGLSLIFGPHMCLAFGLSPVTPPKKLQTWFLSTTSYLPSFLLIHVLQSWQSKVFLYW